MSDTLRAKAWESLPETPIIRDMRTTAKSLGVLNLLNECKAALILSGLHPRMQRLDLPAAIDNLSEAIAILTPRP